MSVLKRQGLHVKAGDVLWMKRDAFDGTYLHHDPRLVHVLRSLTDHELLFLSGDTLIPVNYDGGGGCWFPVPLRALHATRSQAWLAWIQDAIDAGMSPELVAQAQYHAAGPISPTPP